MAQNKAAFLDRDGTLIVDRGYLSNPDGVELLSGVAKGLAIVQRLGYLLVVISNQSGVGRGYFSDEDVRSVNRRMEECLGELGLRLDGVWYCPHIPEARCLCRKPSPGLFLTAARHLDIDLADSIMIGDKITDVEAGVAAGCQRNILLGGIKPGEGYSVATDLLAAARDIATDS